MPSSARVCPSSSTASPRYSRWSPAGWAMGGQGVEDGAQRLGMGCEAPCQVSQPARRQHVVHLKAHAEPVPHLLQQLLQLLFQHRHGVGWVDVQEHGLECGAGQEQRRAGWLGDSCIDSLVMPDRAAESWAAAAAAAACNRVPDTCRTGATAALVSSPASPASPAHTSTAGEVCSLAVHHPMAQADVAVRAGSRNNGGGRAARAVAAGAHHGCRTPPVGSRGMRRSR